MNKLVVKKGLDLIHIVRMSLIGCIIFLKNLINLMIIMVYFQRNGDAKSITLKSWIYFRMEKFPQD